MKKRFSLLRKSSKSLVEETKDESEAPLPAGNSLKALDEAPLSNTADNPPEEGPDSREPETTEIAESVPEEQCLSTESIPEEQLLSTESLKIRLAEVEKERDMWRSQCESLKQQETLAAIIRSVQNGNIGSLYNNFRSLESKKELLSNINKIEFAETIIPVLLFLKDTLIDEIFIELIRQNQTCLRSLVIFYREAEQFPQLIKLYVDLKQPMKAFTEMYHAAVRVANAEEKLHLLRRCESFLLAECVSDSTKEDATFLYYKKHVSRHINLLHRQTKIEANDSALAEKGEEKIWTDFPRQSVLNASVCETLFYTMFYHPRAPKGKLSNSDGIKEFYQVNEKMATFVALKARAKIGDWEYVRGLVKHKFFSRKETTPIGFRIFAETIAQFGGPRADVEHYTRQIKSLEEKYDVALKFRLFELCIETAVALRDRQRLEELRQKVIIILGTHSVKSTELRKEIEAHLTAVKSK